MESKLPPSGDDKADTAKPKVEATPPKVETVQPKVEIKIEPPAEPSTPFQQTSTEQWKQVVDSVFKFIEAPPSYITNFFQTYKRPLTTVGILLAALVGLRVLSGLLDAVDDIPLVSPTFELIGVVYTVWFVYRYLLGADSRKELWQQIQTIKDYVVGNDGSKS